MYTCGVKSQWLKRVVLENLLPADIAASCNDLFGLRKSEWPNDQLPYYECKKKLLKTHGPQPEDDFGKAIKMTLVGLPSDTAKRIRDLMCPGQPKFKNVCQFGQGALNKQRVTANCVAQPQKPE